MRIAHPSRTFPALNRLLRHIQFRKPPSRSFRSNPIRRIKPPFSMAETESISTVSAEEDDEYGFNRKEMFTSNLAGTVAPYERHVFLCHKSPNDWASRVEDDSLPKVLATAFRSRKGEMRFKTNLTICDGGGESDGDVLIFPDMIKYEALKDSDVDGFVDDVLVNGKLWDSRVPEALDGSYVFVCAHGSRDKRCGVCGPALIEKFKKEIDMRGLNHEVFVSGCSHIGGHKYAGNLIIYSPDSEGKITGHWYGYVTPDDVSELFDEHIEKGQIIDRLWRGQMGVHHEESDKGGEEKKEEQQQEETKTEETKEIAGGCCQGAKGFSCCKEPSSGATRENKPKTRLGGPKCWLGTWEQREVLAAAAVVGAVATVAVAYSYYRRSG